MLWLSSYTVWPQPIWIKVRSSWQIPLQHQSTYLGGPESVSIKIPPFRPHIIKFQKKTFFRNKKFFQETTIIQFFMYCKAKKNFGAIRKILNFFFFENLLHKKGLKGGISIDADSGPPRYVRWYLSPSPNFFSDWLWPYCERMC